MLLSQAKDSAMKSPFPGMDPYLEQHWGDVHQAFVTYLRDSLQPQLPGGLRPAWKSGCTSNCPTRA